MKPMLTALSVVLSISAGTALPASAQAPQGQARQGQAPQAGAAQGQPRQGGGSQAESSQPRGAPQPDRAKMEGYLGSQAYITLLQQAMLDAEKAQATPCNSVTGTKRIGLAILAPITFEGDQPTQGTWWERFEADRCGKPATYNILVTHRPGEGSRAAPLLMGTTKADPILQRDAKSVALDTAAAAPGKNKCKEHKIENTQFQGPEKLPQGQTRSGPPAWTELWTLRGCGRQVPVQLRFAPTPQGTAISARLPSASKG